MKIAVINFSGNVGKSTLAAHLFHPRIPGAQVISVESLNIDASQDGVDVEQVRAKQFLALIEDLMVRTAAIVDVGASNAEEFVNGMSALDGCHEEFDFFMVPTVRARKQLGDTLKTLATLAAFGIPANKVRVILNRVDPGDDVQRDFAALFDAAGDSGSFVVKREATVFTNEVYDRLKGTGRSLAALRADKTPWRDLVRSAATDADRDHAIKMLTLQRLSGSAGTNLDAAFAAVMA